MKWVLRWVFSAGRFAYAVLIAQPIRLNALGSVSSLWLRQQRQLARDEFHGVSLTWPLTIKPLTDTDKPSGDESNTIAPDDCSTDA